MGAETPLFSLGKFLISLAFAAAIAPFLFLTITMRRDNLTGAAYPAAAAAVFGFTYIALPLGMLVQLRQQWAGGFLFAVSAAGSFGREIFSLTSSANRLADISWHRKLVPRKPGRCGGLCWRRVLAVGVVLFHYALPLSSALLNAGLIAGGATACSGWRKPALWPIILLTIAINVAAQLGDLGRMSR